MAAGQITYDVAADFFLYNTQEDVDNLGYSVSVSSGVMSYGQTNFGFASTQVHDITSSEAGSIGFESEKVFGHRNLNVHVSTHDKRVIFGSEGEAAIYRNTGAGSGTWKVDGYVNATHVLDGKPIKMQAFAMGEDCFAISGVRTALGPEDDWRFLAVFEMTTWETGCNVTGAVCTERTADFSGEVWVRTAVVESTEATFASAISLWRDWLAVGVPRANRVDVRARRGGKDPTSGLSDVNASWGVAYTLALTNVTHNGTLSGQEEFGYAVSLEDRYLVVGAPHLGPVQSFQMTAADTNLGAPDGGAVFVFPTPEGVLVPGTANAGGVVPTGATLAALTTRVCRVGASSAGGHLGESLSQATMRKTNALIMAGMPYANKVVSIRVTSESKSSSTAVEQAASIPVRCEEYDRIVGFRLTGERDVGYAVGFDSEMLYFGSPSASNTQLSPAATLGRLYVKTYCFPNRYVYRPSSMYTYLRMCTDCPPGRFSHGGGGTSGGCISCQPGSKPATADWVAGAGCVFSCKTSYFGSKCVPCGEYAAGEGASKLPALPEHAHWADGHATCFFECDVGFTAAVSNSTTQCVPPPPPGPVIGAFAYNATSSRLTVVFTSPVRAAHAPLVSVSVFLLGTPTDPGQGAAGSRNMTWARDFSRVRVASDTEAAQLAVHMGLVTPGEAANATFARLALPSYTALAVEVVGVLAHTSYSAMVTVANHGGFGPIGEGVAGRSNYVTTLAPTRPLEPTGVSARNVTASKAIVEWSAPEDTGGLAIDSYLACVYITALPNDPSELMKGCEISATASGASTTLSLTRLTASSWYYVVLVAVNQVGQGRTSVSGNSLGTGTGTNWRPTFTTLDATPPTAPGTTFCIIGTSSTLRIEFQEPEDFGGAPLTYHAMVLNTTSASFLAAAAAAKSLAPGWTAHQALPHALEVTSVLTSSASGTVTLTAKGVYASASYEVAVHASSAGGNGPTGGPTDPWCSSGPPVRASAPGAPLAKAQTASTIAYEWSAPAESGGDIVQSYELQVAPWTDPGSSAGPDLNAHIDWSTGSTFTFSVPLAPGLSAAPNGGANHLVHSTAYVARVRALNSAGWSNFSSVSTVISTKYAQAPSAPGTATLVAASAGSLVVRWTAPSDFGGAPLLAYVVWGSLSPVPDTFSVVASVDPATGRELRVGHLKAATKYYFRVVATNLAGSSPAGERSAALTTLAANVPGTPSALGHSPAQATSSSVVLAWMAPFDTGGVPLTAFYVYGARYNASLGTDASTLPSSAWQVFATVTVPAAPSDSSGGSGGGGGLSAAANKVPDQAHVAHTVNVTHLQASTNYTFAVAARNALGTGNWSTPLQWVATRPPSVPSRPAAPRAMLPSPSSATVMWAPPADKGGVPITQLTVQWRLNTSAAGVVDGSIALAASDVRNNFAVVTGLAASTPYVFRVVATNAAGASPASGWSGVVTTLAATAPGPVPAPTVTAGGATASSVAVAWTRPSETGGTAQGAFTVWVSDDEASLGTATAVPAGAADWGTLPISYTFTGLRASTKLWVRVSASNTKGDGPLSDPLVVTTAAAVAPTGTPTSVSASSATSTSAIVSWNLPATAGDGGLAPESYIVKGSKAGGAYAPVATLRVSAFTASGKPVTSGAPTSASVLATGLDAASSYTFKVSAVNRAGAGADSSASTATSTSPAAAPGAPRRVAAGGTGTAMAVRWDRPNDDGGASITGYNVKVLRVSDGSVIDSLTVASSARSATSSALAAGTSYTATVAAVNSVGAGPTRELPSHFLFSSGKTAPGAPVSGPTAPATAVNGSAQLTWGAPSSAGSDSLSAYVVRVFRTALGGAATGPLESVLVLGPGSTSATMSQLEAGVAYQFTVSCVSAAGEGEPSAATSDVTASTPAVAPAHPTGASAQSMSPGAVRVTWTQPAAVGGSTLLGYDVYYKVGSDPFSATGGSALAAPSGTVRVRVSAVDAVDSATWAAAAAGGVATHPADAVAAAPVTANATVAGFAAGTSVWFAVALVTTAGTGPLSAGFGPAVVMAAVAPGAVPGATLARASAGTALAMWDAPASDGGGGALRYNLTLQRDTGSSTFVSVAGSTVLRATARWHAFTALAASTSYRVIVAVDNAAGLAAASETTSAPASTMAGTSSSSPAAVSASGATASRVALDWSAPYDAGGSDVVGYSVYATSFARDAGMQGEATDSGGFVGTTAAGQSFAQDVLRPLNVRGLLASTPHSFAVTASTASSGEGAPSSHTSLLSTLAAVPPSAPGAVVARLRPSDGKPDADSSHVGVVGDVPADLGGAPLLSFSIKLWRVPAGSSAGNISASDPPTSTVTGIDAPAAVAAAAAAGAGAGKATFTLSGLVAETDYVVAVAASNKAGMGPYGALSGVVSTTPPVPPSPPSAPLIAPGSDYVSASIVPLGWSVPADLGGAPVTSYTIRAYRPPPSARAPRVGGVPTSSAAAAAELAWVMANPCAFDASVTVPGANTSVAFGGLLASSPYYFRALASNVAGQGSLSAPSHAALTLAPAAPTQPRRTRAARRTARELRIEWDEPADLGGQVVDCYEVYVRAHGRLGNACNLTAIGYNAHVGTVADGVAAPAVLSAASNYMATALAALPVTLNASTIKPLNSGPGSSNFTLVSCAAATSARLAVLPSTMYSVVVRARTVVAQERPEQPADGGSGGSSSDSSGSDSSSANGTAVVNGTATGNSTTAPNATVAPPACNGLAPLSGTSQGRLLSDLSLAVVSVTPATVPTTPNRPSVGSLSATHIDINMAAPLDAGGCDLKQLRLHLVNETNAASPGGAPLVLDTLFVQASPAPLPGEVLSFSYANLTRVTDKRFVVQASNGIGASNTSAVLHARTLPSAATAPRNVHVVRSWFVNFTIGWSPPLDTGGVPVWRYQVYYRKGSTISAGAGGVRTYNVIPIDPAADVQAVMVLDLDPNSTYAFEVQAETRVTRVDNGQTATVTGARSAGQTVATLPPLPCPTVTPGQVCSGHGTCHRYNGQCTCDREYAAGNCSVYDGVVAQTVIADDLSSYSSPDSFKSLFRTEMAAVLEIPEDRLVILGVRSGSIVVDFLILNPPKASPGAPAAKKASEVAAALATLASDPSKSTKLQQLSIRSVSVGKEGSAVVGPELKVSDPGCGLRTTCGQCIGPGSPCGWCAVTGECKAGTGRFVAPGQTRCDLEFWYHTDAAPWGPQSEARNTCPAACSLFSHSCTSCMKAKYCEYCESRKECAQKSVSTTRTCDALPPPPLSPRYGWMTDASQCPVERCGRYGTCPSCTADPACGFCVASDTRPGYDDSPIGTCAAGNSFGISTSTYSEAGKTMSSCLAGRWRFHSCAKADRCDQKPALSCQDCLAKSVCGFCVHSGQTPDARGQYKGVCVVGNSVDPSAVPVKESAAGITTSAINSTAPLAGQCGDWRGHVAQCPTVIIPDDERCQAAATCGDCLSTSLLDADNKCGWCSRGSKSDVGFCTLHAANADTSLCNPYSTDQCVADACRPDADSSQNRRFLLDQTGTVALGSVGTPGTVRTVYAAGGQCEWIITPMQTIETTTPSSSGTRSGTTTTTTTIRFPVIDATFFAVDLGPGDTVSVYDGPAGPTTSLLQITAADNAVYATSATLPADDFGQDSDVDRIGIRVRAETGYMLVKFTSDSSGTGSGFWMRYNSDKQSAFDVFLVSAVVIAAVGSCLCMLCFCNRCFSRQLDEGGEEDDEAIEMATARAQRTGRGAQMMVIEKFPEIEFSKDDYLLTPQFKKTGEEDPTCCICMTEYEDGEKLRVLTCTHSFHVPCIDKWLQLNRVCPLCKRDVNMMAVERESLLDSAGPDGPDELMDMFTPGGGQTGGGSLAIKAAGATPAAAAAEGAADGAAGDAPPPPPEDDDLGPPPVPSAPPATGGATGAGVVGSGRLAAPVPPGTPVTPSPPRLPPGSPSTSPSAAASRRGSARAAFAPVGAARPGARGPGGLVRATNPAGPGSPAAEMSGTGGASGPAARAASGLQAYRHPAARPTSGRGGRK